MGVILDRIDFVGVFEISFPVINGRDATISRELDRIENLELIKLMGQELYDLFISNPQDPIFFPLFSPLIEGRYVSTNIKDVVKAFVYLNYQKTNYVMATENGRVVKNSSTATVNTSANRDLITYNEGVSGWKALQLFMRRTYPEFRGIDKTYMIY